MELPAPFRQLSALQRTVSEVKPGLQGRKLPLIRDILEKAEEVEEAEYLIYSNADIGVMPFFYDFVAAELRKGHDAVVINRRRLRSHYTAIDQLPQMYADTGRSHPGFDCFVFRKDLLEKFILQDICVGVPFIGVSLLYNCMAFAENPVFHLDKHLTFHLGMRVLGFEGNAYYRHNRKTFFSAIYPRLKPMVSIQKTPYAALSLPKRALKWILNPSLFTLGYLELEGKSSMQRLKQRLDEIRWRILQR
jgi:hypothetical protein